MLESGCVRPPRAVLNDAFPANNYQVPVPGLHEMSKAHSVCDCKAVSAWTSGILQHDRHVMAEEAADAEARQRLRFNDSSRPRCLGRCEEVAIEHDANFVKRSWERSAAGDDAERCVREYNEFMGFETF